MYVCMCVCLGCIFSEVKGYIDLVCVLAFFALQDVNSFKAATQKKSKQVGVKS